MGIRINLEVGSGVIAWNRCQHCGHEWQDKTMGFARFLTCPSCESEYWKWLSYESHNRQGITTTNE